MMMVFFLRVTVHFHTNKVSMVYNVDIMHYKLLSSRLLGVNIGFAHENDKIYIFIHPRISCATKDQNIDKYGYIEN